MEEILKSLASDVKCILHDNKVLNERLDKLENEVRVANNGAVHGNDVSSPVGASPHAYPPALPTAPVGGASGAGLPGGNSSGASAVLTIQDEFQAIRDKTAGVKIPTELRVGTSKLGIKKEDNNTANLIANSAKYVETCIKLLWDMEDGASADQLTELFTVQKAHIDYLRQEHSSLVVAGQFGQKTSKLFKNLLRYF